MTAPTYDEVPVAAPAPPPAMRRERLGADGRTQIYRHTVWVRLGHWVNVMAFIMLLFSGLQIFNAHPHLYWGQRGAQADDGPDRSWLDIGAITDAKGKDHGMIRLGPLKVPTTGVFGVSKRPDGSTTYRAFPRWLTLPAATNLADGRHFHFFFAWIFALNGIGFWAYGFFSKHFRRDIAPTVADLKTIPSSVVDHIKLKHPTGEAATRYNVLQKLAYISMIFVFLPGMVATGLTMSPGFDAFAPWLLDLFGGRQSARSLHFIFAMASVGFIVIHLVEVVLAGPINEVRSIITGWYGIPPDHDHTPEPEATPTTPDAPEGEALA